MRDYEELVKRLRKLADEQFFNFEKSPYLQAADAIEELSKRVDESIPKDDAEIIIAEVAKPRWIPVTERLPEPFVTVLACIPSEEPLPTVHESYIADHGAWVCILTAERYKTGEVTHWMPMPEPYKERRTDE